MNNSSGVGNITFRNVEEFLILLEICKGLNICMILFTVWLMASMIKYGILKNKWNTKRKGGKLYMACFAAPSFALLRYIIDNVRFYVTTIPNALNYCEVFSDVSDIIFAFAIYAVYYFLWLRQRAIYAHPIMSGVSKSRIATISWSLISFVTITSIVMTCAFVIPQIQTPKSYGCVELEPECGSWGALKTYVLGGFTGIWQMTLLAMFIYPMQRNRQRAAKNPTSIHRASTRNGKSKGNNIMIVIRRSLIFAMVAVCSDSASALLGMNLIPWYYPSIIRHTVYDLNLFINVLSILSTYGKNKVILMSIFKRKPISEFNSKGQTSGVGSSIH